MSGTKKIGSRSTVPNWPGYIRHGKKGPVFIIEKWVNSRHFHVSTRCSNLRAALKQLERFEEDPLNYDPAGTPAPVERGGLVMTSDLAAAYLTWMKNRPRPASREWVRMSGRFLTMWMEDLDGADLRTLPLARLKEILDERKTCRMHRTEVIKAFYGFLRRERGLLTHAEDVSLNLMIPKPPPEKMKRRKVADRERVLAALPHLPPACRDVMLLRLGTSWHISECRRFAENGEIIYQPPGSKVLAVLMVLHKSKEFTRSSIRYPEHLEAAERIRKAGVIPSYLVLTRRLNEACDKVGVARFKNGDIRHSVLTWAVEDGATIDEIARFADHKSTATTKRYYLDLAIPNVTVPVLRVVDGGKKSAG